MRKIITALACSAALALPAAAAVPASASPAPASAVSSCLQWDHHTNSNPGATGIWDQNCGGSFFGRVHVKCETATGHNFDVNGGWEHTVGLVDGANCPLFMIGAAWQYTIRVGETPTTVWFYGH